MLFHDTTNVRVGNKEVKTIKTVDGDVIYDKNNPKTAITNVTIYAGAVVRINDSMGFEGDNVIIDWGDGTINSYQEPSDFQHQYSSIGNHNIKIINALGINNHCFDSYHVKSISIADTVSSLGERCFGDGEFSTITIPSSIKRLPTYCFVFCRSLTSISLPDGLTDIGRNCFKDCTSLTELDIPKSVTTLGATIVSGCSALETIHLHWDTSDDIKYHICFSRVGSNTMFVIPDGTTALYEAKGYPSAKLIEASDIGAELTITSDKNILSAYDNDSCTLTATLTENGAGVAGETVTFKVYKGNTLVENIGSDTTDSNGEASVSYSSQGAGDLSILVECMNLIQTCIIEDCYRYDPASSDKTSSYASPIVYRGSGNGAWNYNSTNGYYGTISGSNEVMIPLSEITGKDDIIIEFDALFNGNDNGFWGIAGICAYENNNNYSRLSCHGRKLAQRLAVNGSVTENEIEVSTTVYRGDLLHFKFTVSNNQIVEEVYKGTTSVGTKTINYTLTNATKFGLALIWSDTWTNNTFLKNIKVKKL